MSHPEPPPTRGTFARHLRFVAQADAGAPGVLAGKATVNRDLLIKTLREMGLGAEVDAILAKDAAGGYANQEITS